MRAAILATAAAIAGTAFADGVHRRHAHEVLHQRRAVQAGGDAGAETSPAPVAQTPGSDHTCGCHTEVITYYGSPTLIPLPETTSTPAVEAVTTLSSTSTRTLTVVVTSQPATSAPAPVETPSETPQAPATSQETSSVAPAPVESSTPVESVSPVETSTPVETPSPAPAPATTPSSVAPTTPSSTPAPELPTNPITSFSSTGVYTIPARTLTVTDSTTVCDATGTEVPSGTHTVGGVTTVVETATTVTCPYATVKPTGSTTTSVIETTTYVCPSAGTYTIAPITTYVPTSTMLVYPTPATYTPGTYTNPEQTMTVTNTDYHYVCPASSSTPAPAPTSAPASAPASTPSSGATPILSLGLSVSLGVPSPSATPENSPSNVLGMTYSPYSNNGQCKGQADVLKDVGEIAKKGFSHVRLYATDCNGLENVGKAAKQHKLKMIVGVYIDSTGVSGAQKQVKALSEWAQWDMVTLVVVGNEAINDGYVTVAELAGLISSAKKTFQQSGYNGDVTTSEPINIWEQQGKSLCSSIDSVGANIHPFFNAQTTADQAGKFARSEVKILEGICPGKDVMILETGWPSGGDANGAAVPGKEQQTAAIKALVSEVGKQSVFFSYSNDLWKSAGEFDVERYWGCIENF